MAQSFIQNLLKRNQDNVQIAPLQMDEYGNYDPAASANLGLQIKQNSTPMTLNDRLFGREMTQDYQSINPETNQVEMSTLTNYKPGLLNDISSGFKENYTQGFNVNNLAPEKKGLATRIGEGLGTLARFYDKPIGRMAVATGLAALTGETNPLNEGVTAYIGRQGNMTRDKAYRQNLQQMGFTPEEVASIPGIMTDDIYKNLINTKQLQEQQKYRELYLGNQQEQNKIMNQYRQDQLKRQAQQDAIQNSIRRAELGLKARGLDIQEQKLTKGGNQLSSKDMAAYRDNLATLKDIEAGLDLIEKNPNAYSLAKGVLPAWATNRIDPKGIPARTQIDNITAVYRKWLTGAQMSDAERKAYERFLPAPTDNYQTVKAKLQGMRDSIERKNSILTQGASEYQNMAEDADPLGVL